VVAKSARIGEGSHIGPHCFIDEGVEIGRNAVLHSLVTLYKNVKIGDEFLAAFANRGGGKTAGSEIE